MMPAFPVTRFPMCATNLRAPSLVEIILGSILSVLLGAVLAATILVLKPVEVLKEAPKDKELDPAKVYYFEGRKEYTAGQRWRFKRDSLMQGHSIRVNEDELNTWIEEIYPRLPVETKAARAATKPKAKGKTPEAAAKEADGPLFSIETGTPNFRVTSDTLRIGVIYYISVFGHAFQIVVQSAGTFEKPRRADDPVDYKPSVLFVGSLPVHKLLVLKPLILGRVVDTFEFPADLAAVWAKLTEVKVENRELVFVRPEAEKSGS